MLPAVFVVLTSGTCGTAVYLDIRSDRVRCYLFIFPCVVSVHARFMMSALGSSCISDFVFAISWGSSSHHVGVLWSLVRILVRAPIDGPGQQAIDTEDHTLLSPCYHALLAVSPPHVCHRQDIGLCLHRFAHAPGHGHFVVASTPKRTFLLFAQLLASAPLLVISPNFHTEGVVPTRGVICPSALAHTSTQPPFVPPSLSLPPSLPSHSDTHKRSTAERAPVSRRVSVCRAQPCLKTMEWLTQVRKVLSPPSSSADVTLA